MQGRFPLLNKVSFVNVSTSELRSSCANIYVCVYFFAPNIMILTTDMIIIIGVGFVAKYCARAHALFPT